MATKLILQRDIENLGIAGDVVEVKDGYARNFLLPRRYAVLWTKGAQRHLDRESELRRKHEITTVEDAIALRDRISKDPVITIQTRAGDTGRLFGAITARMIAAEMEKQYGSPFDPRAISFEGTIKSTGKYDASIRLLPEVIAPFEIEVTAEED